MTIQDIKDNELLRNNFMKFINDKKLKASEVEYIKSKVAPEKMTRFFNSIGGNLSIGSVKVSTVNLMHICYEVDGNPQKYLDTLRKRVLLDCKALDIVRHIIKRNVEKGLLPNYCEGGIEMSKQYCTIGILGLHEVLKYYDFTYEDEFGYTFIKEDGMEFAKKIFEVINDVKDNFECDYSFNIESVPAERAAVILAQKDKILFNLPKKTAIEIYSNQWIPLTKKVTLKEKLRTAAILDNLCSGGAIAHVNIENGFKTKDEAWDTLNLIALSGVIYFAFNPKIPVCSHNHASHPGAQKCERCGEEIKDWWSRIVGFFRPTSSFSKEKKNEYAGKHWLDYQELMELGYTK